MAQDLKVGEKVKVANSHNFTEWHGATGKVEKRIPFNKAYVQIDHPNERVPARILADVEDLDRHGK